MNVERFDQEFFKRMGSLGGKKAQAKLTKEERRERASRAAKMRWENEWGQPDWPRSASRVGRKAGRKGGSPNAA